MQEGADAKRSSPRLTWDADAYLDSLEPIGWRLGLERMHKLTTALGLPQHRFASIHVVGTNGKSSVTRMDGGAAGGARGQRRRLPLAAHLALVRADPDPRRGDRGRGLGRARSSGSPAPPRASTARLEEGEAVTQFEAATAATFVALAAARVKAAAIEAGLGGRLDATNTIPSRVTVLTSIGLDHTEWLGETELEIAAEKLAVLRDQSTLVLGRVSPDGRGPRRTHRGRTRRPPAARPRGPRPGGRAAAPPERFQRRNFALAMTAAEAFLGALDPESVARVAATVAVPGRLELVAESPPTYVDAAHNPDGAAALWPRRCPRSPAAAPSSPAWRSSPTRTPPR